MIAVYAIDQKTFLCTVDDRLSAGFSGRVFVRNLHQQMRVLDVGDHMLGIVDLPFQRNSKISLENLANTA